MKWQLRGLNIKVNGPVKEYAAAKIKEPLEHLTRQIESIVLRFADPDKVHHGAPKFASAMVLMHDGSVLKVEQKEDNIYSAIDVMADRIKRAVKRKVERRQKVSRRRHSQGKRMLRGA